MSREWTLCRWLAVLLNVAAASVIAEAGTPAGAKKAEMPVLYRLSFEKPQLNHSPASIAVTPAPILRSGVGMTLIDDVAPTCLTGSAVKLIVVERTAEAGASCSGCPAACANCPSGECQAACAECPFGVCQAACEESTATPVCPLVEALQKLHHGMQQHAPNQPRGVLPPQDSAVTVAAAECPAEPLTTIVYKVADLVVPINGSSEEPHFCELAALIEESVSPESWTHNGGRGSLFPHASTLSLVIRQTPAEHARVAALLEDLRRQQDLQVCVEVKIFEVPGTLAEKWELPSTPTPQQANFRQLQVKECREANLCFAPKVTLFNGQNGMIETSTVQAAAPLALRFQAVASADRRFIRLTLGAGSNADAIQDSAMQSYKVEDGASVMVALDSLTSVEKSSRRHVLWITPRIIISEEEDLLGAPQQESPAASSNVSADAQTHRLFPDVVVEGNETTPVEKILGVLKCCPGQACSSGMVQDDGTPVLFRILRSENDFVKIGVSISLRSIPEQSRQAHVSNSAEGKLSSCPHATGCYLQEGSQCFVASPEIKIVLLGEEFDLSEAGFIVCPIPDEVHAKVGAACGAPVATQDVVERAGVTSRMAIQVYPMISMTAFPRLSFAEICAQGPPLQASHHAMSAGAKAEVAGEGARLAADAGSVPVQFGRIPLDFTPMRPFGSTDHHLRGNVGYSVWETESFVPGLLKTIPAGLNAGTFRQIEQATWTGEPYIPNSSSGELRRLHDERKKMGPPAE